MEVGAFVTSGKRNVGRTLDEDTPHLRSVLLSVLLRPEEPAAAPPDVVVGGRPHVGEQSRGNTKVFRAVAAFAVEERLGESMRAVRS